MLNTKDRDRDQPIEHPMEHPIEHQVEQTRTRSSQAGKRSSQAGKQPAYTKRLINLGTQGGKESLKGRGLSDDLIAKIGNARKTNDKIKPARKENDKIAPRTIKRKQRTRKQSTATATKQKKAPKELWEAKELKEHTEQLSKVFVGRTLDQCAMISYKHETKTNGTYWEEKIMTALAILNGMQQDIMDSIVDYGHVRKTLKPLKESNWFHGWPPKRHQLCRGFWPRVYAGYKLVDDREKNWVREAGRDLAYLRWKEPKVRINDELTEQELDEAIDAVETDKDGRMVEVYHLSEIDQDLWNKRTTLICWIIKIIYLEWRAHPDAEVRDVTDIAMRNFHDVYHKLPQQEYLKVAILRAQDGCYLKFRKANYKEGEVLQVPAHLGKAHERWLALNKPDPLEQEMAISRWQAKNFPRAAEPVPTPVNTPAAGAAVAAGATAATAVAANAAKKPATATPASDKKTASTNKKQDADAAVLEKQQSPSTPTKDKQKANTTSPSPAKKKRKNEPGKKTVKKNSPAKGNDSPRKRTAKHKQGLGHKKQEQKPNQKKQTAKQICRSMGHKELVATYEASLGKDVINKELSMEFWTRMCAGCGDPSLAPMMHEWETHRKQRQLEDPQSMEKLKWSINGLQRTPTRAYADTHNVDLNTIVPPTLKKQEKNSENRVEFDEGSDEFDKYARTLDKLLNAFLTEMDYLGYAPDRWNWLFSVKQRCKQLDEKVSGAAQSFTIWVLIHLTGATNDKTCFEAIGKLFDAGLLSVDKLAEATPEQVLACIKETGLTFRCQTLIDMAKIIRDDHNGMVPCDYHKLVKLVNAKRKSAMLFLTEGCSQFLGITSDVHVMRAPSAYELMLAEEGANKVDAEIAESCIRMWMPQRHFPRVNKIFGSFAQLFTNTLRNPSKQKADTIRAVFQAMDEVLWNQKQVTLVWSAIRACRTHYQKERVENARKRKEREEKKKMIKQRARKKAKMEQLESEEQERWEKETRREEKRWEKEEQERWEEETRREEERWEEEKEEQEWAQQWEQHWEQEDEKKKKKNCKW